MLDASPARGRFVDVAPGQKIYVIEAGEGPPVVLLHGSSSSSLALLPLLEQLDGVRGIAIDRPGFGLSDPMGSTEDGFWDEAIRSLDGILDALGLSEASLVGSSMGGTWALRYALARPERVRRLVLLGAAPALPGTQAPLPIRAMVTPVIGSLLQRIMSPGPKTIVRMMETFGEGDSIVDYPEIIDAVAAIGNDPLSASTDRSELQTIISPLGFRREFRLQPEELGRISVQTLMIWGDRDPLGSTGVAETVADLMPEARLEILPAGHIPWFGNPDRTAELVSTFAR